SAGSRPRPAWPRKCPSRRRSCAPTSSSTTTATWSGPGPRSGGCGKSWRGPAGTDRGRPAPGMARRNAAYEWAGTAGGTAVLTDNSHANEVRWLALALVLLAAALFKPALRLLFGLGYTEAVAAAAAAYGLDPRVVAAVVKVESGFNERGRCPRGALGLM